MDVHGLLAPEWKIRAGPSVVESSSSVVDIRMQTPSQLVSGPEAMEALRKSMIRRANAVLSKGRIVGVWPEEWIVQ